MIVLVKNLPEPLLPPTRAAYKKPEVIIPEGAVIKEVPCRYVPPQRSKPKPKHVKQSVASKPKRNRDFGCSDGHRRRWTDEEIQVLIQLYNDGVTLAEIIDNIKNHSEGTIKCKLSELRKEGLIGTRVIGWTKEQEETLLRMRKEGTTYAEISKLVGKSICACRQKWFKLEGL